MEQDAQAEREASTPTTPGTFTVRIDFADADDLLRWTRYAADVAMTDGQPGAIKASLAAGALKRAKIKPMPATPDADPSGAVQDLIEAAQWAADAMRNMRQGRFQGATARLDKAIALFGKGKAQA